MGQQPYLKLTLKLMATPGRAVAPSLGYGAEIFVRPGALTEEHQKLLASMVDREQSGLVLTGDGVALGATLAHVDELRIRGWFDQPLARAFVNELRPAVVRATTWDGGDLMRPTSA